MKGLILILIGVSLCIMASDTAPNWLTFGIGLVLLVWGWLKLPSVDEVEARARLCTVPYRRGGW